MAVKIHRDPKKVALIGVPTSAGSHGPGAERAPAALRAAGLVARLEAAGYEVVDHGDTPTFLYQPDEEHPRARNTAAVVQALGALRSKVELAVKSGALLLILGGDCAITPGTVAGVRRYYREAGVLWMDRDADLNTPTTSPSGCVHGMTVAHLIGRGAAEIVRFSADMPMVREPNLALYGIERLDPPEEQFLVTALLHSYRASDILRRGAAATAREAVEKIHGRHMPFVLHYDVDVISSPEFTACGFPAEGSLRAAHVREALAEVVAAPRLLAIELCEYFPERDADGSAARFLVELFAEALAGRLRALTQPSDSENAAPSLPPVPVQATAEAALVAPAALSAEEVAPAASETEAAPVSGDAAAPAAPTEPARGEALSVPAGDAASTSAGK
ncbi:MAG TPA: arginase family protein [Candidatus Acidoferrales bacterium]|nr:arginase family protein [Candidatus Acidoferrales bacterium]